LKRYLKTCDAFGRLSASLGKCLVCGFGIVGVIAKQGDPTLASSTS
jgi:hypothetical protein